MGEPRWSLEGVSTQPGVYLFRDDAGGVLYVGKARNLKARLRTYRTPGGDGRLSIQFLERDAARVETIITRTEQEALLLEDTLIKQHKPVHNIRLKDDKSFLMLRLDLDERFPRLKFVRAHRPQAGKAKGRSRLFGPFASARSVRRTLSDLHRVVPLRDCSDAVMNHRTRPCLKHQIGLCSAPCVGLIDEADYGRLVERAGAVLTGQTAELEGDLETRMRAASEELEFELAAHWRDRLQALRRTVEGQGVRPRDAVSRDVLGLARRGADAVVHRLAFRERRLAESRSHVLRSELPDAELLHDLITALYGTGRREVPRELVVSVAPAEGDLLRESLGEGLRWTVPSGGERARMLHMAEENATSTLARDRARSDADADAAQALADFVGLEVGEDPLVIDCFDVSHFQASHVVASRVRFRAGSPDRDGYRRYRVRTVEGQDDFASMREVVGRSLRRGMKEGDLPSLVVIDGGAQQLATALEARDEAGAWDVAVVSLAKARAERKVRGRTKGKVEERVYLRPDAEPVELPSHSAVRNLFERVRDEAHRFAITYHRKERGRIKSALDSVPGIGPAKRKSLLRKFGSAAGVREASVEEIAAVPGIGMSLARTIVQHLGPDVG